MVTAGDAFANSSWHLQKAVDHVSQAADALEAVSPEMCMEVVRLRQGLEDTVRATDRAADVLSGGVTSW